jgi:hypothetical protein
MSLPRPLALSSLLFTLAGCGREPAPVAPPPKCPEPPPAAGPPEAVSQTPAAPASAPAPAIAPTPQVHGVGAEARAHDYSLVVTEVQECQVKYYFKPKKGNIKLGVEVLIEAVSDKEVPVNPYYAKITDSEGHAYVSTFGGCEPELKAVRVTQAQPARGWITFEVPEAAKGLVFSYSPIIIGGLKQNLEFDLGR